METTDQVQLLHQPHRLLTTTNKAQQCVVIVRLSVANNSLVSRRNSFKRITFLVQDVANWPLNSASKNRPSKFGSRTVAWRTNVNVFPSPGPSLIPCSLLTSSKPLDILIHSQCLAPQCQLPAILNTVISRLLPLEWPAIVSHLMAPCLCVLIRTAALPHRHSPPLLARLRSNLRHSRWITFVCQLTITKEQEDNSNQWSHLLLREVLARHQWCPSPSRCIPSLHRAVPCASRHHQQPPAAVLLLQSRHSIRLHLQLVKWAISPATDLIVPMIVRPVHPLPHRQLRLHHRPILLVFSSPTNCTICPPKRLKSSHFLFFYFLCISQTRIWFWFYFFFHSSMLFLLLLKCYKNNCAKPSSYLQLQIKCLSIDVVFPLHTHTKALCCK